MPETALPEDAYHGAALTAGSLAPAGSPTAIRWALRASTLPRLSPLQQGGASAHCETLLPACASAARWVPAAHMQLAMPHVSPCFVSSLPRQGSFHARCTAPRSRPLRLSRAVRQRGSHGRPAVALQCGSQQACAQACHGQQASQRGTLRRGEAHLHGHGEHCRTVNPPLSLRVWSVIAAFAAGV